MTDDIEVLVHISTPATRENDDRFRSIADAYTKFEPHKVHRDQRVEKPGKAVRAAKLRVNASSPRVAKPLTPETTEPLVPPASRDLYGSFPSQLSTDKSLRIPDFIPDDSVRPVSRLAQLEQSYTTWRKRASPKASSARGREGLRLSSYGPEDADTGFIEDSQTALQALQSQLEDTWSMTSADSSDDDTYDESEVSIHMERLHELQPSDSRDDIARDVDAPGISQAHARQKAEAVLSNVPSDLSESQVRIPESRGDAVLDQLDFSNLPFYAVPPPPAVSVESPAVLPSQISKHLAAVKTRNPSRFKPVKVRRELETDERGYWHIDCTKWPSKTQHEFWTSLYEHVCSGRLGWGTTLHRESTSTSTLGLVRLYCWGEVVEHMWLLMWLCSQGNMSNLESSWIDADGVMVVEIR